MDKGFICSVSNFVWKMCVNHYFFAILLISIFLSSCSRAPHPIGPFECAYKNASTEHYYFGEDESRDAAMFSALQACQEGPVPWNCNFRYCNEVGAGESPE